MMSKTKTDFWEDFLKLGACNISQVVLPKHEVLDIQLPAEILNCSFYEGLWTEEERLMLLWVSSSFVSNALWD